MSPPPLNEVRDWFLLGVLVVGWIVSIAVMWTKLINKVNGLGGRVKKTEETYSTHGGRSERMEREIAEYRRDTHEALANLARVEKGVDGLKEEVGVKLHSIEKSIVRLETIQEKGQEKPHG